jgi:hypothetical protein
LGYPVSLRPPPPVEADFGLIQRKHLLVTGSTLRSRTVEEKATIIAALKEKVWPLWVPASCACSPTKRFLLLEAAEAHHPAATLAKFCSSREGYS